MSRVTITNESNGNILAWNGRLAASFGTRLVGLLGRRAMPPGEALVLYPCQAVHSFFMKFPLDVLFVTREGRVVAAIETMKPFRLTVPVQRSLAAIELPEGVLRRTGTKLGDIVTWFEEGEPFAGENV